jgi:predicted GIY-YIG superfamily endonuclease
MPWSVYILQSVTNPRRTYCGASTDPERRLKEHNDTKSSRRGAKYTRANQPWKHVAIIDGFQNESQALQFEWKIKHIKRRYNLEGRCKNLIETLKLDRWTSKAVSADQVNLTVRWFVPRELTCFPEYVQEVQYISQI